MGGEDFPDLPHDTNEVFAALLGETPSASACGLGEACRGAAGGFGDAGRSGDGSLGEEDFENAVERQALVRHLGSGRFFDEVASKFFQRLQTFAVEVHESNRLPEGTVRPVLTLPFVTMCDFQRASFPWGWEFEIVLFYNTKAKKSIGSTDITDSLLYYKP